MISRKTLRAAAAVLTVGTLTLTACSSGGGGGSKSSDAKGGKLSDQAQVSVGTAADSQGPAKAVEGAKAGGTVKDIERDDFEHLDPAQVYTNTGSNFSQLITRGLTGYKQEGSKVTLVGDLATDAGKPSDGGKTWTFTLKDGVKWENGEAITSADVKHSIERTFAPFITQGASYVQQWLTDQDYRKAYEGPYGGKHLDNVIAQDPKTIVFKFDKPHADFNYAMAMTTYAVVSEKGDTKEEYDKKPLSSGPYKIVDRVTDKTLTLERNTNWDAKTDPIRNAYPDKWNFEFGFQAIPATDKLIAADKGEDQTTMSFYASTAGDRLQKVLGDASLKDRLVKGNSPYADYYWINNKRITNQKVREALIQAWPLQQIRQTEGGPDTGDYSRSLLNPTVAGFQETDVWGKIAKPEGDPDKAKALLKEAGAENQKIVYAYNNTPKQQQISVVIESALKKAGFDVVIKPIDTKTWYDEISKVDKEIDVFWGGWGADWPTGATVLPVLFDGRTIADGSQNYSNFNDPEINAEIDRIMALSDSAEQNKAWGALDKKILEKAPAIPGITNKFYILHGSKIGGAEYDPLGQIISPNKVFLKP
ncbi:ABC transporter [Kitasatospora herbaricolor]|uniref:ABC transporter substrate-binding protein n=1 Tax=Kitasatospora herbaricolor TaxID=68217 RepID=UPI00174D7191|nr:ABC transporter substrate-binding protein [Kitasatospora herbaricolor]MDQ0310417.1 peptide/nickel transport system substrate-binding protein [Kitasatospora herbaricolor]GGV07154.1 ABC transporter [Kitasatospora herbaricolor]